MALVSAGVQVTVVDESIYFPSVAGTVPYILIATASNKQSGVSSSFAKGTLAENANKLYLITSQYDLLETYGNPIFSTNGSETNEYGLLAAYSALGISNRCYVQRVDVDLSALVGSLNRPSGKPIDGKYYLDVTNSKWGFNVWNGLTSSFTYVKAYVITNPELINPNTGVPIPGYGAMGDIAVVATDGSFKAYQKMRVARISSASLAPTKNFNNTWQQIGSTNWVSCVPWSTSYPNADVFPSGNATINSQTTYQAILATSLNDFSTQYPSKLSTDYANVASVGTTFDSTTNQTVLQWYTSPAFDPNAVVPISATLPYGTVIWEATPQSGVPYGYINQPSGGDVANAFNWAVYQPSPSYKYPSWNLPTITGQTDFNAVINGPSSPTGSIWQNVSDASNGSMVIMKKYNAATNTYTTLPAPFYYNAAVAEFGYDPQGGGYNIPVGTLYTQYDAQDDLSRPSWPNVNTKNRSPAVAPQRLASHTIFKRYTTGATQITGTVSSPIFSTLTFAIGASRAGSSEIFFGSNYVTIPNNATVYQFIQAFSSIAPANVTASLNAQNQLVITHSQGGSVYIIENNQASNDIPPVYPPANAALTWASQAGFSESATGVYYKHAARKIPTNDVNGNSQYTPAYVAFSNWNVISQSEYGFYENGVATDSTLTNNTIWYWNDPTQADIMIQNNGQWRGYRNVTNSVRGENLSLTDPLGPIFSATAPIKQSNGNALVVGDLWIDTSDLENYPKLSRWTRAPITGALSWQSVVVSSAPTSNGMFFADARWANDGVINPGVGQIVPIQAMLTSNYLDLDAPNPALYPQGTLLFNTRRSSYNVKQYIENYFTSEKYPNQTLPVQTATWLSIAGIKANGSAYMGRQSQRAIVVKAMKSTVDTSIELREEQKDINLLAAPQYPELAINLDALNVERGDTGFVIVDTPLRLNPNDVVTWATNNNGLGISTGDGLTIGDPYAAAWYPSCATTDLSGNSVVTCPSHMIIRTILKSDRESYPWVASAGTQRGLVDNAVQIGYLDAQSNNFVPLQVNQGLRDVLYTNRINPITVVPGSGIANFGNHTLTGLTTAMDRINVARLVAFLRRRLAEVADQYLFEPNDEITRNSIKNAIDGLMIDLVTKRALYDYLVVCDLSNNTPFRIDNNELWVDIAIEPVKAVEFIYIPVRIKNTGAIGSSAVA